MSERATYAFPRNGMAGQVSPLAQSYDGMQEMWINKWMTAEESVVNSENVIKATKIDYY